jgi:hypothetical protein
MDRVKILSIILFALIAMQSHAQWAKKAEVTNVKLIFVNDKIEVTYNIATSNDQQFYVSVSFYSRNHTKLNASSLCGDMDTIVSLGAEKKIIWDIKKDYPLFNDDVYAEISAVALHHVAIGKAFLYSTLFPGAGSSQITGSKLHLVSGVLFFSCISASLIFSNKSSHNYSNYKSSYTVGERNSFYEKAENNRKLSINLLYAGTGLYLLNYGLTYLNLKRSAKKYKHLRKVTVFVNTNNYGTPLLSYKLTF